MEIDKERLLEIFKYPGNQWSDNDKKYIETLVCDGKRDVLKSLRDTVYQK